MAQQNSSLENEDSKPELDIYLEPTVEVTFAAAPTEVAPIICVSHCK